MLYISYEDISKVNTSEKPLRIDAIINAVKTALMGSNQGVDGDVCNAIDKLLREAYDGSDRSPTFNDKIKEELRVKGAKNQILCPRGSAVITGGYGLCDYLIHVVGSEYDIGTDKAKCSTVIKNIWENMKSAPAPE